MAIIKHAKNMNVTVETEYKLSVVGKLEKIANKINVEATQRNLSLISNKKIVSDGNKN